MQKRAQITVFIIIGVVILLSVGLLVYFTQRKTIAPISQALPVPQDIQQVYDYVTSCVQQSGREGIELLGAQGGYITLPARIEKNPTSYVSLDPLGIIKTPQWYYEGEDRTPSLESMQTQLAQYVKENLPDCINNFASFEPQYSITAKSEPLPIVTFTDTNVIIKLSWPLTIKTGQKIISQQEFLVEIPVRLKQMYDLADKTMLEENTHTWFENLTIDLLSANSRIPLTGMEFSCGAKKWYLQDVQDEIKNTLAYNIPTIRVANTKYPPPLDDQKTYDTLKTQARTIRNQLTLGKEPNWPKYQPSDTYEMNRMMMDVKTPPTTLKAAFQFDRNWPLLLHVAPSHGNLLSTSQMQGPRKYLRFLCINQWHFAFDLIYPVKMIIRDDDAFNSEGFLFQFAFPIIIKDNEQSRKFFGIHKFVVPENGGEFCTTLGSQTLDVRAKGFIANSPVAEELDLANITYRCLQKECDLGNTFADGSGATRLLTYLPEGCGNPTIIAQKDGYLSAQGVANQDRLDLQLTRLKQMNYTLQIHPYYEEPNALDPTSAQAQKWLDTQIYSRIPKSMHATISLSLHNGSFDQYLIYPANATQFNIESFNYSIGRVGTLAQDSINFVEEDSRYDIDILLFRGDTPIGGYHAENISIPYEEIASNANVVFPVIEYRPMPEKGYQQAGMFDFLYERGTYQDQPYQKTIKPQFLP